MIWTHHNRCVFDGASPNIRRIVIIARDERKLWSFARARGISFLTTPIQIARILELLLVAS